MPRDNVAANGRSAAANFQTNADLFMNIRMRLPCPRGVHNRNRIIFIYLRNRLYRVYLLFLKKKIIYPRLLSPLLLLF